MKKKLSRERSYNALYKYHCAVVLLDKAKEYKAPSVVMSHMEKLVKMRTEEAETLGLLGMYPSCKDTLERERLQAESEAERKFDCLHHAETTAKLSDSQAKKIKRICPYGGFYGSHDTCTACSHFKPLSDDDRERLEWYP